MLPIHVSTTPKKVIGNCIILREKMIQCCWNQYQNYRGNNTILFHIWICRKNNIIKMHQKSIGYNVSYCPRRWMIGPLITNSSDVFTNLFHEFFPRIFLSWNRKQTSYWSKTVFSQFAGWKRNHIKYSLKKFVDSEFEIGETIWWTTP